jgi:hypothetical protein
VEALATPLVHIARSLAAETAALIGGGGSEQETSVREPTREREPPHHLPLHLRARQLQVQPPDILPILTYPNLSAPMLTHADGW